MSYLLPLKVRQNYHVKKGERGGWDLVCLACKQAFHLDTPKSAEDVQPLIVHTKTHEVAPIEEAVRTPTRPPPTSIPPKMENAYMVVMEPGKEPTATAIKLQHPLVSPSVDKHGKGGYLIILHAANPRHAVMVSERLVREYHQKKQPSGAFRFGTLPPKAPTKPPQE